MGPNGEKATSWTPEERERFLKSLLDDDKYELPLLAESVDEMDPDMVAALVALRDGDEPPSVLAEAAKDRGNKHFSTARKTKKMMWYKQAAKEYTDGLSLCLAAADVEASRPSTLESMLSANRAACALALGNYGDAKRDCKKALALDQTNVKALYRLSRACAALKQWEAAKDAAEWALTLEPDNQSLAQIQSIARCKLDSEKACIDRLRQEYVDFFIALDRLGIRLAPHTSLDLPKLVAQDGAAPPIVSWPVVVEYPEVDIPPDYIEAASTDDCLADWLIHLFPEHNPPPWDEDGQYYAANLLVYVAQSRRMDIFSKADAYAEYRLDPNSTNLTYEDQDDVLYLQFPRAATLRDLVAHHQFAVTGPVKLQVRPLDSPEHIAWRDSQASNILTVLESEE